MSKIKRIFTDVRILVMIFLLVASAVVIHYDPFVEGVAIRSVTFNSSASLAGIKNPEPTASQMSREKIISINGQAINTVEDYHDFIETLEVNKTVFIETDQGDYVLKTKEAYETITLNETEEVVIQETIPVNKTINGTETEVNETINKTVTQPKTKTISSGMEDIGLKVYKAPKTNIKKGLDLEGGTRVLLQPEEEVEQDILDLTIENLKQRLNVFGLTDIMVTEVSDLSGNQYILVEIAGATEDEVKDLIAQQGKFEARIGNETVFRGGEKDITYVCRSADCSGIDPRAGCGAVQDGYACRFYFSIALKPEAAQRQADVTQNLEVVSKDGSAYLSKPLDLYLDDTLVDTLQIAADLKGRAVTDIQITGSGIGTTERDAALTSLDNMKSLQTVLVTGSLPIKLDVVRTDRVSPVLGEEFVSNALLVGAVVLLSISLLIGIRYRKWQIILPMIINVASELILLLGAAALIRWNLDLAAIAGIIIVLGTGVDHAIVITDEAIRGEQEHVWNWKKKIKNAFFIIFAAFFTSAAAMIPLWFAGAGILKGFAVTTILGLVFGVFITRPAFARMIEILLKDY